MGAQQSALFQDGRGLRHQFRSIEPGPAFLPDRMAFQDAVLDGHFPLLDFRRQVGRSQHAFADPGVAHPFGMALQI